MAEEETAPDPQLPTFADVTDRLGVVPKYLESLGTLKLNTASANLNHAKAELTRFRKLKIHAEAQKLYAEARKIQAEIAKIMVQVRQQTLVVNQLERDLKRLNQARGNIDRDRRRLAEKAKLVDRLLTGRRFPHASRAWGALDSFLVEIYDPNLFEKIKVTSAARQPENFIHASKKITKATEEAPGQIQNVLQFAAWMRERRYLAKAGSEAQWLLRRLVGIAAEQRLMMISELESRLEKIEKGTFEDWKLPYLLEHNIPDSVAASSKRIQDSPATTVL